MLFRSAVRRGFTSFTTDPSGMYADASNTSWGILYSYVAPPTYLIGLNNYDPYVIAVSNDVGPSGSGTSVILPSGTVFLDEVVQMVYPHAGPSLPTDFYGLAMGATYTSDAPEKQ